MATEPHQQLWVVEQTLYSKCAPVQGRNFVRTSRSERIAQSSRSDSLIKNRWERQDERKNSERSQLLAHRYEDRNSIVLEEPVELWTSRYTTVERNLKVILDSALDLKLAPFQGHDFEDSEYTKIDAP